MTKYMEQSILQENAGDLDTTQGPTHTGKVQFVHAVKKLLNERD